MQRFEGRSAIVTGGGSGIGAAVAERLASEGARVYLIDTDVEGLRQQSDRMVASGGLVFSQQASVCNEHEVALAITEVVDRWGALMCSFTAQVLSVRLE